MEERLHTGRGRGRAGAKVARAHVAQGGQIRFARLSPNTVLAPNDAAAQCRSHSVRRSLSAPAPAQVSTRATEDVRTD